MPGAPRRVWGPAPPALPAALRPPLGSSQQGCAPSRPPLSTWEPAQTCLLAKHSSNSLGQKVSLLKARQDLIKPSTRTVEPEIRVVKGGETAIEDRGPEALPPRSPTALQAQDRARLGSEPVLTWKGDNAAFLPPELPCGWVLGSTENLGSGEREPGSGDRPPLRLCLSGGVGRVLGGLPVSGAGQVETLPSLRAAGLRGKPVRPHAQVCPGGGSCPGPSLACPGGQSSLCTPRRQAAASSEVPACPGTWL